MSLAAFDSALLFRIHGLFSSPLLDRIMVFITQLGDLGLIWLLLAAVLLLCPATRRTGACVLLAMALGLMFGNGLLKNLIVYIKCSASFSAAVCLLPSRRCV